MNNYDKIYKVKVNTPWNSINYQERLPASGLIVIDKVAYNFEVNNECDECDYWIIWGGINDSIKSVKAVCPADNIFFITEERYEERKYSPKFLSQFSKVVTARGDIVAKEIIWSHEINTWHLSKSFDYLRMLSELKKTKEISIVSSDLVWLKGHKDRFAFVNRLIGHFKDKLDVYGRGFNPIADKWNALASYKYSIAIENNRQKGYFTEKLTECYLALTMPIYYGAPDINTYFSEKSMLQIDISDYISAIRSIERLLEEDPYDSVVDELISQKNIFLDQYNFFQKCAKILYKHSGVGLFRKGVLIKNENTFTQSAILNIAKRLVMQRFQRK